MPASKQINACDAGFETSTGHRMPLVQGRKNGARPAHMDPLNDPSTNFAHCVRPYLYHATRCFASRNRIGSPSPRALPNRLAGAIAASDPFVRGKRNRGAACAAPRVIPSLGYRNG